jgi:hypothetical protein
VGLGVEEGNELVNERARNVGKEIERRRVGHSGDVKLRRWQKERRKRQEELGQYSRLLGVLSSKSY